MFGGFSTGFIVETPGVTQISWTIGTPGEFTSVYQALNGVTSPANFAFEDNYGFWLADAQPYDVNPIPEPGSFLLLGTGVLGLIGALRRRLER
jgi:hypothetical protein